MRTLKPYEPKPWPVFTEPTPEQEQQAKLYFPDYTAQAYQQYNVRQVEMRKWFLEHPLWRVCYRWVQRGHTGLSPFALAHITRHKPQEILEEAVKESGLTMSLCGNTQLPVIQAHTAIPTASFVGHGYILDYPKTVEELTSNYHHSLNRWIEDGFRNWAGTPELKDRNIPALFERFAGEDWRKHCKVSFTFRGAGTHTPKLTDFRQVFNLGATGYL